VGAPAAVIFILPSLEWGGGSWAGVLHSPGVHLLIVGLLGADTSMITVLSEFRDQTGVRCNLLGVSSGHFHDLDHI
jgi:hypothetical protein